MKNNEYPFYDLPRIVNDPAIQLANKFGAEAYAITQLAQQMTNILPDYSFLVKNISIGLQTMIPQLEMLRQSESVLQSLSTVVELSSFTKLTTQIHEQISCIHKISGILPDYGLLHIYSNDISDGDNEDIEEANEIIIGEIFKPIPDEITEKKETAIITLSPINDDILKYLAEHPEAMYHLSGSEFEDVMAELYNKLGYDVHKTKRTRDGGKDIIIRKPDLLGDFILYVECKKYAANRPIGVSIVRNLESTISMDRVNGGILATISFFTKDARELILSKNLQYQIRMQDYNDIRNLLTKVV